MPLLPSQPEGHYRFNSGKCGNHVYVDTSCNRLLMSSIFISKLCGKTYRYNYSQE
jgi:hypothetical protein